RRIDTCRESRWKRFGPWWWPRSGVRSGGEAPDGTDGFGGQSKGTVEFRGAERLVCAGHGDEYLAVQFDLLQRHVVVERREAARVATRITVHRCSPPGDT